MKKIFENIRVTLAPMAGYTDIGFRALCLKYGAQLTVTEMVSVKALTYKNHVTADLLRTHPDEKTKCVQLFGNDPEVFARAVLLPEIQAFDIIDINMGCPARKIVENGEGSALMRNMPLAAKIIRAVKSSGKTVTVKFRKGFDDNSVNAPDFAKMCQDNGADALTIHGRTAAQLYSGKADWNIISKAAAGVSIPVYLNGDVKNYEDASRAMSLAGIHGVAVGRASCGKPWLFASLTGSPDDHVTFDDILFHYNALSYLPERVAVNEMKKHLACYLKGFPNSKKLLVSLTNTDSLSFTLASLEKFFASHENELPT